MSSLDSGCTQASSKLEVPALSDLTAKSTSEERRVWFFIPSSVMTCSLTNNMLALLKEMVVKRELLLPPSTRIDGETKSKFDSVYGCWNHSGRLRMAQGSCADGLWFKKKTWSSACGWPTSLSADGPRSSTDGLKFTVPVGHRGELGWIRVSRALAGFRDDLPFRAVPKRRYAHTGMKGRVRARARKRCFAEHHSK